MTAENMFESGATTPPATETQGEQSLLTALVGEKQKYKTPEELAKAYTHADEFIQTLKAENAKLREEVAKAKTLDEVMQQLKAPPVAEDTTSAASSLTVDQVAQIVEQQLTGLETRKTQQANLLKADKMMKEKFGDKAVEVFKNAVTSEAHKKVLTELAAVDPDKFVALFANSAPAPTAVDVGTVNTTVAATSNSGNKPWSKEWVADVRKKDPNKYWSTEFQYQLQEAVAKNPTVYFG